MIALAEIKNPTGWKEINIAVSGVKVERLKKQMFYSGCKNYLCNTFTVDDCVVEVVADVTTFDFTKGSTAMVLELKNSTFYAPAATTKSFYSSQAGQKLTEARENDNQTFKLTNDTFYNLAPTKNFFTHRQNNQKWLIYEAKGNVFVNCGKSGQVIVGLNGGGVSTNPTWDIDGNLFNFNGIDTSESETTNDTDEPVKNSIAGVVTFTDAESGNFNGMVKLSGGGTLPEKLGDPRFTLSSHTHSFNYSATGATITATCTADGCTLPPSSEGGTDHVATLTIAAPTLETYGQTGEGISANATLTDLTDFNTATGKTIAATDIKYVGRDGTSYAESGTAPTNAGKYTAKITVEGQTASVNYEIAKASTSITANPAASEITYGQTLADSTLTGGTASVAGTFVWEDSTVAPAVSDSQNTEYTVVFTPEDANNATAECKVKLTVNTAENPITYPEKQAVTKTFSTASQTATLEAAKDGVGELSYGITSQKRGEETVNYFTLDGTTLTLAKNTPVGTYTVVVWTRAAGNGNVYGRIKESEVTVTIDKATPTVTAPTPKTLTYTGSAQKLVNAGSTNDGTLYYTVTTENTSPADESLYTTSIPSKTDAGTYYVWYKAVGDENHNDTEPQCIPAVIAQSNVTITYDVNGGTVEEWQKEFWEEIFSGGTEVLTPDEAAQKTSITVPDMAEIELYVTPPKNCGFTGYEITLADGDQTVTGEPGTEVTGLDFTRGAAVKLLWEECYYTLTLHASTVDGDEMADPIRISVGNGTEFEEALRQLNPSYNYNTSLFSVEGYSDVNHYRVHRPMSEYLKYDSESKREYYFAMDTVWKHASIGSDTDVYYILTKPVDQMELTVDAPVCGEETTTPWDSEAGNYDWYHQVNSPWVLTPDEGGYVISSNIKGDPYSFWTKIRIKHLKENSRKTEPIIFI